MRFIILAAFVISAIAAVQIDAERIVKNRHGLRKEEKSIDFKFEKKTVNTHNHKQMRPRRFHHIKKSVSSETCSQSKSVSKSISKSFSKSESKDKKQGHRHNKWNKRPQHKRFPVKRDEKEVKVVKVGAAQ